MHTPGPIGQEGEPMTDLRATEIAIVADDEDGAGDSAVSWAAVAAGAVAAAAPTPLFFVLRRRDRSVVDFAVVEFRRVRDDLQRRCRHLSGGRRHAVLDDRRLSGRPAADAVGR